MKTECFQTKWNAASFGMGKEKDRVMLIKSLINVRVENGTLRGMLL